MRVASFTSVAGLVQQIAEIEARILGEISEERGREGRVRAWIAVRRELARPGGIGGDHRAVGLAEQRGRESRCLDLCRASGIAGNGSLRQASSITICCGAGPAALYNCCRSTERIVVLSSHVISISVGASRFLPLDRHAVACVVDQRDLGSGRVTFEFLQGVEQAGAVEVVIFRHLEAVALELRGDGLGVRHGIGQLGQMLVVAHADDEGDALGVGR